MNNDRQYQTTAARRRPEPNITGAAEPATLKWFNPEKKFGFVVSKDRGDEVFLHISALEYSNVDATTLTRGQNLTIYRGIGKNKKESVVKVEIPSGA